MSSHVAPDAQVTSGLDRRTELREFLRSRRARIRPEDVGLASHGRRRVPGLRREELAQLAGVSYAYYARLEQGYGDTMSSEVLDAVARVLRLSEEEREHLGRLAQPERQSTTQAVPPQYRLRPSVQHLLDTIGVPAYVVSRRMDIRGTGSPPPFSGTGGGCRPRSATWPGWSSSRPRRVTGSPTRTARL